MTEETLDRFSPLYCRYNGTMMGFFLAGAFAHSAKARYPVLRARMHEFLEEAGSLPILPEEHDTFIEHHERITREVLYGLSIFAEEVCDFAMIGSFAMHHVVQRSADPQLAEQMWNSAIEWMSKYDVPEAALRRFSDAVERTDAGVSLDELHCASLLFLDEMLAALDLEPETAFVVMPFSDPYRKNFSTFYVPLLERVGYRGFRAWGGLASESYWELLLTLIEKSAAALVELSEPNLNVMYEIGFADGTGRPTFLLVDRRAEPLPSNLAGMAVVYYESADEGWEDRAIDEAAAGISLIKLALEQ